MASVISVGGVMNGVMWRNNQYVSAGVANVIMEAMAAVNNQCNGVMAAYQRNGVMA